MEAVFPPKTFRIFSDDFRPIPAGKLRELTGIHRKKNLTNESGVLVQVIDVTGDSVSIGIGVGDATSAGVGVGGTGSVGVIP